VITVQYAILLEAVFSCNHNITKHHNRAKHDIKLLCMFVLWRLCVPLHDIGSHILKAHVDINYCTQVTFVKRFNDKYIITVVFYTSRLLFSSVQYLL